MSDHSFTMPSSWLNRQMMCKQEVASKPNASICYAEALKVLSCSKLLLYKLHASKLVHVVMYIMKYNKQEVKWTAVGIVMHSCVIRCHKHDVRYCTKHTRFNALAILPVFWELVAVEVQSNSVYTFVSLLYKVHPHNPDTRDLHFVGSGSWTPPISDSFAVGTTANIPHGFGAWIRRSSDNHPWYQRCVYIWEIC